MAICYFLQFWNKLTDKSQKTELWVQKRVCYPRGTLKTKVAPGKKEQVKGNVWAQMSSTRDALLVGEITDKGSRILSEIKEATGRESRD